jgi:hypothetical protein
MQLFMWPRARRVRHRISICRQDRLRRGQARSAKTPIFGLKIGIAQEYPSQSLVSQYFEPFTLRPDGMVEFDCPIIRLVAGLLVSPPPPFVKGYMVIGSDIAPDVVAVYSGWAGSTTANSFSTERVPARCVPVCEDLVLPLPHRYRGLADGASNRGTPKTRSARPVTAPMGRDEPATVRFLMGQPAQQR